MSNLETYLQTGEVLAKFLDTTSREQGDRAIAGIVISLLEDCINELSDEQNEELNLAKLYWNSTITKIPRQFFTRIGSRVQNDDRSGAEHSKHAWLTRLMLVAFGLESDHHSYSIELIVEYALQFDIGASTLEATIARNIQET